MTDLAGEVVDLVLFPAGVTAGVCFGGGIGAGGLVGDSTCLVHDAGGTWGIIFNTQIGGVSGASAEGQVSYFRSTADSVNDLQGVSYDVSGSFGEFAGVGADVDVGLGTHRQIVITTNFFAEAGVSTTPIMGAGAVQSTTVKETWR